MDNIRLMDWQVPLAEHQTKALTNGRAMLSACGTGSGKTYLACQTIRDLKMPTLVVCPKIARSQWRSVIAGMGAEEYVIDVVNPEQLSKKTGCSYYKQETGWAEMFSKPTLLVFDEVHRGASGIKSKTTEALARWCNKAHPDNKVLMLSATPFDSPMKMRGIGYVMGFHRFVTSSFYDWCRQNGCSNHKYGFGFTTDRTRARTIMADIRRKMGERFLSVTPEDIPGFPEETKEVILVDLAEKDYEALVKAYAEMPPQLTKMTQDARVKTLRLRQQAEFCKAGVLAEMAMNHVADGNSVFVCLNFTDARLRLQKHLEQAGVEFASIYGGQPEKERQAGIDAFQSNKIHVTIGMAPACSVALSLHDVRHERPRVSLISPGYSAAEFSQALGRIRRVGGTHATQFIVMAARSVEERVGKTIERNMDNIAALMDSDFIR